MHRIWLLLMYFPVVGSVAGLLGHGKCVGRAGEVSKSLGWSAWHSFIEWCVGSWQSTGRPTEVVGRRIFTLVTYFAVVRSFAFSFRRIFLSLSPQLRMICCWFSFSNCSNCEDLILSEVYYAWLMIVYSYSSSILSASVKYISMIICCRLSKAQVPLHRLSPKLPRGESHEHKSRKSRTWHVKMFATKSVTSLRQTRLCRFNGI